MSSEEDINADSSSPDSSPGNPKDNGLFDPKPQPKVIRVLTVLAYILSVSMAAILLSIYYVFMWDGQPHVGARRTIDIDIFNDSTASRIIEPINHQILPEAQPAVEFNNFPLSTESFQEMQQQMTAIQEDHLAPTSTTSTEENATWSDYDLSSEFESKTSTFIKKLMYNKYPYAEND